MSNIDKKALKILLNYNPLVPLETVESDFQYAKEVGLIFDKINENHDETVDFIFEMNKSSRKEKFTDLFLASLSNNRIEWRSGIAAYAIMQSMPNHRFQPINITATSQVCGICSSYNNENVDKNFFNQIRFSLGGLVVADIYDFKFILSQHNTLEHIKPKLEDLLIFKDILNLIKSSNEKETPTLLIKRMKEIRYFKTNKEQSKIFLETLGYCSILETSKHRGFLNNYIRLGIAPSKTHSSDWAYPVDWWTGKDGINKEALEFWFGNYPELKDFLE